MGKVKDEFIRLAEERFWKSPLMDMLGIKAVENDLIEEKLEIVKGDYKTTVIIKFTEEGEPVIHYVNSVYSPSEKKIKLDSLKRQMADAVQKEDFVLAQTLKTQIKDLETNT